MKVHGRNKGHNGGHMSEHENEWFNEDDCDFITCHCYIVYAYITHIGEANTEKG
jgi:hypothetical protein